MEPLSSVSGIASGVNFRDLVDAIVAAQRQPIERARQAISEASARRTALENYRSLLVKLRDAAAKLASDAAFDARTVTITGTASGGRPVLRASAAATAVPGRYSVEVQSLARAEKRASTGQLSATDPLNLSGEFSVNGRTITIDASDSLADIRDAINAANTGSTPSGVTATILSVAPNEHRLVLSADATGSAGMSLADTNGSVLSDLGLLAPSAVISAGSDAVVVVDGITITRSSNKISDAIEGVTLQLETAELGTVVTLTVDRYTQEAVGAAKAFVDAYNAVVEFVRKQAQGELRNDPTLRTNRSQFAQSVLSFLVSGAGGDLTGSALGFSLTRDGRLNVDEARFQSALESSFEDARSTVANASGLNVLREALDDLLAPGSGILDARKVRLDEQVQTLESRIARMEDRLESKRAALLKQYIEMERLIGTLQSQGNYLSSQLAALQPRSSK
ncbi:MAG TPA: flagellar filament capping protein FliD [Gemmatimonadaceae bacterium]|nr:flagellar filament capping protein FliD [Gemmatimonadaceae bacterium]